MSGEDVEMMGDVVKVLEELRWELKTTKTTCERLRKENAKLRGCVKMFEEVVLIGDVVVFVDGFFFDGFLLDGMLFDGLSFSTKARRGATKKTAARCRVDVVELCELLFLVIDEFWMLCLLVMLFLLMGVLFIGVCESVKFRRVVVEASSKRFK